MNGEEVITDEKALILFKLARHVIDVPPHFGPLPYSCRGSETYPSAPREVVHSDGADCTPDRQLVNLRTPCDAETKGWTSGLW